MDFTFADIIVLGIITVSVLFSLFFGFVWEILFFGSWIGAGLAAYMGFSYVSPLVEGQLGYGLASDVISALGLFFVALVLLMILTQFISTRVRHTGAVGMADRMLGVGFGLARGVFVVVILWLAIDYAAPEDPPATVRDSISLPYVKKAANLLLTVTPEGLRDDTRDTVGEGRKKADAARDLLDAARRLQESDAAKAKAKANNATGNADADATEKGYKSEDSRELERIIENATGNQ